LALVSFKKIAMKMTLAKAIAVKMKKVPAEPAEAVSVGKDSARAMLND